MENSPNSMELQIDTFLEQFKRSASKAMDGDWVATTSMTSSTSSTSNNLVKSKSRSSCSNVAELSEENINRSEMISNLLAEREATEVLHSLLSVERLRNEREMMTTSSTGCELIIDAEIDTGDESEEKQSETTIDIETIEEQYPKNSATSGPLTTPGAISDPENYETGSDADDDSLECVELRLQKGCECKYNCFKDLDKEQVYGHRTNIAQLTKDEHDMYLMGVTMASISNIKKTSRQKDRQRNRASYVYQGKRVCLEAFLFLENVTFYHVKRIRDHILKHGVVRRKHGNIGRKPHNTFSLDMYERLKKFIEQFLRPYVVDFNKDQVIYGITRVEIYNSYKDHGREADEIVMGYTTFRRFMRKQFPHVKFQKLDNSKTSVDSRRMTKKKLKTRAKIMSKSRVKVRRTMENNIAVT